MQFKPKPNEAKCFICWGAKNKRTPWIVINSKNLVFSYCRPLPAWPGQSEKCQGLIPEQHSSAVRSPYCRCSYTLPENLCSFGDRFLAWGKIGWFYGIRIKLSFASIAVSTLGALYYYGSGIPMLVKHSEDRCSQRVKIILENPPNSACEKNIFKSKSNILLPGNCNMYLPFIWDLKQTKKWTVFCSVCIIS